MGDEFRVDPRRPQPLVSLPRGSKEPTITLWLEWAKSVAGCIVCNQPIPRLATRFSVRVKLAEPITDTSGRTRATEKYSAHPGCLTGPMGQEIPRAADQCWDCGRPPEDNGFRHPWAVFTTTKFAPSWLCHHCIRKTKWAQCSACHMYFPHWMVSPIVGDSVIVVPDEDIDFPMVAEHRYLHPARGEIKPMACPYCEIRFDLDTIRSTVGVREEFEALRERIAHEGVFGGDDDG